MRVLFIEDNPGDARLIRELCLDASAADVEWTWRRGFHEIEPKDPSSADVVLLDLSLGETQGLATFRLAKNRFPGLPIVVLTGSSDVELACQSVREGAQDYLVKGEVDGALLLRSIHYSCERKQIELALLRERDFAEQLIEAAQTIVVLVDPLGRLIRLNQFMQQTAGYELPEVWGRDWVEAFFPPEEHARMRALTKRALAGESLTGENAPLLVRGGQIREIHWLGRPVSDAKGQSVGVLFVGHDITELKMAQERALRAERLAAIGEMVAGLAHESRNALQRSQACLERLALRVRDRPEACDLIDRIQAAQDHLQYLHNQLRTYAAPVRLQRVRKRVDDVVEQAWRHLVELRGGRTADMRHEPNCEALELSLDPNAMEQVFRNILENALQACSDPVEVLVSYESTTHDGRDAVRIAFRDNGPGLTVDERTRIFEPFFTNKTHGTGLGMAIARRLVEAHGGQATVGAATVGGAEIVVILPRTAAKNDSTLPLSTLQPSRLSGAPRSVEFDSP